MELLREAALHTSSLVHHRLEAADDWYRECQDAELALEAAICILELLELAVRQSRSLNSQYARLTSVKYTRGIAASAAAIALDLGKVGTAISLLEQGRGLIFSQLSRYRVDAEDVELLAPELAEDFKAASEEVRNIVVAETGGNRGRDPGVW